MSGRARLPSGEPRKASQRRTRRATPVPIVIEPSWRSGDKVHWRGYTGAFLRDAADGQAEALIGTRTYLVPPCCMDRGCGRTEPDPCSGSCDADTLWASQVQHAVQHVGGDRHL